MTFMIGVGNNRDIIRKILIKYPFFYHFIREDCSVFSDLTALFCDSVTHLEFQMGQKLIWPPIIRNRINSCFFDDNLCKLSYIYNFNFPLILNHVKYRLYTKIRLMELKLGPDKVGKQYNHKNIKLDDDPETLFKYRCYMGNIEPTNGDIHKIKRLIRWLIKGNRSEELLLALMRKSNETIVWKKSKKKKVNDPTNLLSEKERKKMLLRKIKLTPFIFNYSIYKMCMYNKCMNVLSELIDLAEDLTPECFIWCILHNNREAFKFLLDYITIETLLTVISESFGDFSLILPFLQIVGMKYEIRLVCSNDRCNNYLIKFDMKDGTVQMI